MSWSEADRIKEGSGKRSRTLKADRFTRDEKTPAKPGKHWSSWACSLLR